MLRVVICGRVGGDGGGGDGVVSVVVLYDVHIVDDGGVGSYGVGLLCLSH